MRMDRIELGIITILAGLVVQLWLLLDMPGKIRQDRREDTIIHSAHAEDPR